MIEEPLNLSHYRCRCIYSRRPGLPIVFLHGYNYTSYVWRDIGLLQRLDEEKIPYLALDMPYGARSMCSPRTRDPEENVEILATAIKGLYGGAAPLLVGASLGGYIALRYAVRRPVSGLLLIAPVKALEEELVSRYDDMVVPTMIIWGSRDRVVSREEMVRLAEHLDARLIIYEEARHAAYLDYPERFAKDLIAFYRALHLR